MALWRLRTSMLGAHGAQCLICSVEPEKSMSRTLFFVLAGTFGFAASLPLKSGTSDSWADVTFGLDCEDYGPGIWYDRQFDFPTGGLFVDVPVWAIDAGLFAAAAMSFGFYAKKRVQAHAE